MSHNLTLSDVSFSYENKPILNDFSYSFTVGRPYAITGKSGTGKTTLLRLIAGLEKPGSGSIIGGGNRYVGMAFQDHRLFPSASVIDNVVAVSRLPKKQALSSAAELLLSLGIDLSDQKALPDSLSGGMKQRVSIARTLFSEKPVLLFDEPTSSLDSENAKTVHTLLTSAAKRVIVIVVTHGEKEISELNAIQITLNNDNM